MTADELATLGRDLIAKRQAADLAVQALADRDEAEGAYSVACEAFLWSIPDPAPQVVEIPPVVVPEPVVMPPIEVPPVVEQSTDLAHPAPETIL